MFFFFPKPQRRVQAAISEPNSPESRPRFSSRSNIDSLNALTPDFGGPAKRHLGLRFRRDSPSVTDVSTCGYLNGNGSQSRTANPGFDCRVDTKNAIWGFCPTTVVTPSDCGLVGACIDSHACDSICNISGVSSVTTFTCTSSKSPYCSIALLINGPDQTYSYLACESTAKLDTYFNTPTSTSSQASTSSNRAVSGATPSVIFVSSTSLSTSTNQASTTQLAGSFTLTSSQSPSPSMKGIPSPSYNAGAIVGGVLGGLALLSFVVASFLFYRRLQTRQDKETENYDPAWKISELQQEFLKTLDEEFIPAELPTNGPTAELSSGKHSETTELPNNIRPKIYSL